MQGLVLFLSFFLFAAPALAQTATSTLQAQIDETADKIRQLQAEIAKLQTDLDNTSKQKQTLQTAVKELDLNIQKLQKSITLTQTQINQKDKEIKNLSGDITTTEGHIGNSKDQVADSLRELAVLDEESLSVMLLANATLSSFFDEATKLESLRTGLQNHIDDLKGLKIDLTNSKTVAQKKRTELANLKSNLTQQQKGLSIARAAQNDLLQETKNKEAGYQALIKQKQEEESRFEAILYELSSELGTADASHIPRAASGVLNWPLDKLRLPADITQRFGKTVDSVRLYASRTHDGIDFRAFDGTPVRAALSGTVQEVNQGAVQNCQYGKWVLVRHDNGLATLYAHLSSIGVQKGETVQTGTVIGLSGRTGYATGPHLHFTVYLAEAVEFKQYRCKSGRTVTIPIAATNAYLDPLSYLPAW